MWETLNWFAWLGLSCISNTEGSHKLQIHYAQIPSSPDSEVLVSYHCITKVFGIQEARSTEHAIVQQVDWIRNSFESNQNTLGIFDDLSKVFNYLIQLMMKF